MGSLNNCCSFNCFENNNNEDKFQTNFLNSFQLINNDNKINNFIIHKISKNDIEYNLRKIKQKFAIKKILKQFKLYKLKTQILTPIHKLNGESLMINSNSLSNFLMNSVKLKKVSNFIYNKKSLDKLLFDGKVNSEKNINEIEFNTSAGSLSKRSNFNKYLQIIINNNRNYISYDRNHLIKQRGIIKYTFEDNNFYIGQFFRNNFFGYGLYINNKNIIYEGYWKNNIQNGYGIEFWENSSIYKGEFNNGYKNGSGTYIWPDKTKYEGEWKNNYFNGYGIYYYSENKTYLGEWKMNEKNGYGIYLTNDIIYIGNYSNDKKNGFGIYYWRKKNEAYIGFFKDGKQFGFGKYIFNNKKSKYGIWSNENNNKVKWFKNIKDVHNLLIKNELINYKYFFLFDIDLVHNYCNIIINDEILNPCIN